MEANAATIDAKTGLSASKALGKKLEGVLSDR